MKIQKAGEKKVFVNGPVIIFIIIFVTEASSRDAALFSRAFIQSEVILTPGGGVYVEVCFFIYFHWALQTCVHQ